MTPGVLALGLLFALMAGSMAVVSPTIGLALVAVTAASVAAVRVGLRRTLLGVLILTLTAVRFEGVPIALSVLRYAAVVLILAVTWHAGRSSRQAVAELPDAARWLLRGLWTLTALAVASNVWSISPSQTLPQTAAFASLTLLLHLTLTCSWRSPQSIAADMAVVFWTLSATVAVGLIVRPPTHGRLYGLYNNPNALAMSCALAATIGIGLMMHYRRPLYLAPLAMLATTLLLTQTRTSIIALTAAIVFILVKRGTSTLVFGALSGALAVVAVVAIAPTLQSLPGPIARVAGRFMDSGGTGMLSNRDAIWSFAYQLWLRHPMTGYGFRSGEVIFEAQRNALNFDDTVAHNSYIQMLVELGLMGIVPSAILIFASILALWRCHGRGLAVGMAACVLVGFIIGASESAVFGVGQSFCWALWLAIAAAASLSGEKPSPGAADCYLAVQAKTEQRVELAQTARSNTEVVARRAFRGSRSESERESGARCGFFPPTLFSGR